MLSLQERLDRLVNDLLSQPPRISAYHDLPFAMFRYDPHAEWQLRRELRLRTARLQNAGKQITELPLSRLLWEAIDNTEGLDAVAQLEEERGFAAAQEQVTLYLSHKQWEHLLPDLITNHMSGLNPACDVVFLTRAAAMAPAIYHLSALLDGMKGRTQVPVVLFYPGIQRDDSTWLFMGLEQRAASGNYRVSVY